MDEELSKLRKHWSELSPEARFLRMAKSVATSCAIETGEDPEIIYKRMIARHKEQKEQKPKP